MKTVTFNPATHAILSIDPTNEMTSKMADALEDPENDRSSWDLAENMFRAMIAAAPEYPSDAGWISVDERLPELGAKVVIVDADDPDRMKFAILVDLFGRKNWELQPDCNKMSLHQYTHWMARQLPPAPEGV